AQQAVRALARPEADRAFRERLRRDFAQGRIGEGRAGLVLDAPRPPLWRWALAAATALALVAAMAGVNRTPGWAIAAALGAGPVTVDGQPMDITALAELSNAIRPGAHLHTTERATLILSSAAFGMIQVAPGSDVTLPRPPGRWFPRSAEAEVRAGIVR